MSRFHNLNVGKDEATRGVQKQKYPLDDYLINPNAQASLLSPISPVSSPDTVHVLQSAERLVQNAQKQIMEVSFDSALNNLDENTSDYAGQQPLDERLLYVREIVASKFHECNDPNGFYIRKAFPSGASSSNKKQQHDQFPVKESSGILNKPSGISEQNYDLSANRMASGILLQNQKPFFKKEPNWFRFEQPKHINVFPNPTTSNLRRRLKVSTKVPHCTTTNTGVIEINSTDHPTRTIQVQTGPTVDIRRGLTVQTIQNVHIPPDPSAVSIYNNIATYCFQHDPLSSSSSADSKKGHVDIHSAISSVARNIFDSRKERHIQSTDRNDIRKQHHMESTHDQFEVASIRDSNSPSQDRNQDTIRTDNSNHSNKNTNIRKHYPANHEKEDVTTNLHQLSIGNKNLQKEEVTREIIVTEAKHETFDERSFSKDDCQISTDMGVASFYDDQKLLQIQSDEDHAPHSECVTGSCSRKCERVVEYKEKQKLKEALESIANIGKLGFDLKNTGIVPAEYTQKFVDQKHCLTDAVNEFALCESEQFKTALENLCKSSQNTKASRMSTDSEIFQGAIDDFVKMFYDSKSPSNHKNSESKIMDSTENKEPTEPDVIVDKLKVHSEEKVVTKIPKQVKLIPKTIVENHHRPRNIIDAKINSAAVNDLSSMKRNPGQSKELNRCAKPLVLQRTGLPKRKASRQENGLPGMISNEEKMRLDNFDLQQPCVSDVDAVLKVYHESMAAICLGTEQLSQLISHHIVKNAIATANQISSTIPHSVDISNNTDAKRQNARNENIPVKRVLDLVSCVSPKISRGSISIHQKNTTAQNRTQIIYSDQIKSTAVPQPTSEQSSMPHQEDDLTFLRDNRAFSNENNLICTNKTPVSATHECSSTCSKILSERERTLLNNNEKSSPIQFNLENNISDPTSTLKKFEQNPLNIRTELKNMPKPEGNEATNIQCPVAEPSEGTIPIGVTSDEENFTPQSHTKNPLSTYLDLENACGGDMRSHRRSNYDIHSDHTPDYNLYKCPVLISGPRDNLNASSDCNDESTAGENIVRRREMELQVFGEILDAMKNSSKFMKRSVISLFNGMEIDSISDVVRNLKDAEVHPIIIEQFLLILKEKNKGHSLLGGNIMSTNPKPVLDDWLKDYKESTNFGKTENMNSFKHSAGFNGSMETTNIQISKGDEDLGARQTADTKVTQFLNTVDLEMNLNSQHVTGESLNNKKYDNFTVSKTAFENKCDSQNEAFKKPQQDYPEIETRQSNIDAFKNSMSNNTAPKNNDSESNTDKDISFQIPHDADVSNEVADLSTIQQSTSVTLKNGHTREFVGLQTESNDQNSLTQEKISKLNSNSRAGKSPPLRDKGKGKLESSNVSESDHASSTKNLQTDDRNTVAVCGCGMFKDHEDPNTGAQRIPCKSSLDAVNATIELQIQNDYKRLGLLDPEKKADPRIPDRMTPTNETMTIKRSRPSKVGAAPRSPVSKATDPVKLSVTKKKLLDKKVSENRKLTPGHKQGSARGVRNTEASISEKSDPKHFCALCTRLPGKCKCSDCANCLKNSNRSKKILTKPKKGNDKPIRNILTRSQSRSPKHLGHSTGKSPPRKKSRPTSKELSPRSTAPLVECESKDCSDEIQKCRAIDKESQSKACDSTRLKMEDRSQNTLKTADSTVCKSTETCYRRAILLDKSCSIISKKLGKITEIDLVDKSQVKEVGTLICPEICLSSLDLSTVSKNNYLDGMNTTRERITTCTETKDFSTMGSQTSENRSNFQEHRVTSGNNIPETGTVSTLKTWPNIFEEESIVVLQPLNGLDHTFFIAKPNCVERKIIQEKLNRNFNVKDEEIVDRPSVYELNQRDKQISNDVIQLNNATSPMSCVRSKECQARYSASTVTENSSDISQSNLLFSPKLEVDSEDNFLENHYDCPDLCTNEEDCLGICPQTPPESYNSRYNCKQNCTDEEACRKRCASVPRVESSSQNSLIDINGLVEKLKNFIAENGVSSVKLRIVEDLLPELKKVQDSMDANNEKLGTIDERSESQNVREMRNAEKSVGSTEPNCEAEGRQRKSIQYDEPHEKVERMVMNKKSLILHNIVRSVADMHPSTKWQRLNLRTGDPLVAGNFNKSKADKRYAVFNRPEPGNSSFDLNDPRLKAHLESAIQTARMHREEYSSPNYPVDANQSVPKSVAKKSNDKHAEKLNKIRRGMDADSGPSGPLNNTSIRHDIISMKSFESSDLEPGEFLQVRTPFDGPTKSPDTRVNTRVNIDLNIGEQVSQEETKYSPRNKAKIDALYIVESLVKDDSKFRVLNDDESRNSELESTEDRKLKNRSPLGCGNERDLKTNNPARIIGSNSADQKLNSINLTERTTVADDAALAEINNNHSSSAVKDSHGISDENQEAGNLQKHSKRLVNRIEWCNRPQIIDHFLGKRTLEDMKIEYNDDKTEEMTKGNQSLGDGNWQLLYKKSNFRSKTTHDLDCSEIRESAAPYTNHSNEIERRNCSKVSIRRWDHTSSDTYSEGEINFPSSCSYSVGEIKLSTPSSTNVGTTFKDPDGFTIFVTKSVLDSTNATCTSPGEILAEIQKTATDSSSSLS